MGVRDLNDFCHLAFQVTDGVYAVRGAREPQPLAVDAHRASGRRARATGLTPATPVTCRQPFGARCSAHCRL